MAYFRFFFSIPDLILWICWPFRIILITGINRYVIFYICLPCFLKLHTVYIHYIHRYVLMPIKKLLSFKHPVASKEGFNITNQIFYFFLIGITRKYFKEANRFYIKQWIQLFLYRKIDRLESICSISYQHLEKITCVEIKSNQTKPISCFAFYSFKFF